MFSPSGKFGTFASYKSCSDVKEGYKKARRKCKVVVKPIAFLRPLREFSNMVLRKTNIHVHWVWITRFNPLVMIWLSACTYSSSFRWNTACKNSSPLSWYLYSWYLCPWGKSSKTVFGLYFLPLFSCISSVWIAFKLCPSRAGNWIQLILRTIFTGFAQILFNGMRILLEGKNGGKIWIEVDFVP